MVTHIQAAQTSVRGVPLAELAALLRRRAWLIVVLGVLGAAMAYSYARTLPKSYTASSIIAVAGSGFAIPELQGALQPTNTADPMPIVHTEMQALTSRDLVLRVVEQLHLDRLPDFNPELRPPSAVAQIKSWLQSFLPVSTAPAMPGSSLSNVVGAVTNDIRIFQDGRSLTIDVGFVSHDPNHSALIANTLVADYMAIRARRQASANAGASEVMTQRINEVHGEIDALEKRIDTVRAGGDMVALPAGSVSQQQLEDLATAAAKASIDRAQLEANYSRAQSLVTQGAPADLVGVLGSTTISQLRDREAAAAQKVAELSSHYGSSYPGVLAAQADLQAARAQLTAETRRIVASMGTQLRVAQQHEADIKRQLEDARRAAVSSENGHAKLKQLQDEVAARQKLYQTMLERAQQTSGQPSMSRLPDVYVISTAAPPTGPTSPNTKMAAGLGGVGGASLGCLLAMLGLRTTRHPRFEAGTMVAGLPMVGSLTRGLLQRAQSGTLSSADLAAVWAVVQGLRAGGARVVAVAGAGDPADAAASVVAWARTALERGDRVAVIDTDVAAPASTGPLPGPREDLVAALSGSYWPDASSDAEPFHFYAATVAAPSARELLSGPRFANLVAQVLETADLVLLLVPDHTGSRAVLRQAEAGLLVVRPGRLSAAVEASAARLAGAVPGPVAAAIAGARA